MTGIDNDLLERLERYLDELEEMLDHIKKILTNEIINRDEGKSFFRPYRNICEIEELIKKTNKKTTQSHYSKRYKEKIKKFNSLFSKNKLVYTQFVTYELTLLLGNYNNDVLRTHLSLEQGAVLGEYADGGFSDDALSTRDLIEEVICGIKRIHHTQFYPWMPLFETELTRYDNYTREIIEKETTYYAKIDAIRLPPNYLEWFSQPFWWRELELYWYNQVKKRIE